MNLDELGRAARRLVSDRLDLLKGSLDELGVWFKEHVARLIGQHVGAAVRDALASVLGRHARHRLDDEYGGDAGHQGFGVRDHQPTRLAHTQERYDLRDARGECPHPEDEPGPGAGRWEAALSCGMQLFSWWLRQGFSRSLLPRVLALGAVAGLVTHLVGPLAGGVLVTAGTALFAGFPEGETHDPAR